jgi:uncharacterized RDD family membrane protein YckC
MSCPQCQSTEIDSSGKCKHCGYQAQVLDAASASEPETTDSQKLAGMIEIDYSEGAQESPLAAEIPQWRKDLSQRLHEIKQKKEAAGAAGLKAPIDHKLSAASDSQIPTATSSIPPPAKPVVRMLPRKPVPKSSAPIPLQKTLQPLAPEVVAPKTASQAADPQKIQKIIDSVVLRQSPAVDIRISPAEKHDVANERMGDDEGKWILLSRTLSGLVDLICIVLCAGVFILAADFFCGIVVLDFLSLMHFSVLFLLMYFIYSFFFLSTSHQTIGMMITDLHVVAIKEKRPSPAQLMTRCCCYLVSLLAFGIGLLWSLFDRKNMCLHDRLSGTTVIRI